MSLLSTCIFQTVNNLQAAMSCCLQWDCSGQQGLYYDVKVQEDLIKGMGLQATLLKAAYIVCHMYYLTLNTILFM